MIALVVVAALGSFDLGAGQALSAPPTAAVGCRAEGNPDPWTWELTWQDEGAEARGEIQPQPMSPAASEWTVSAGTGWGVPVFGYGSNNGFVFQALSWGRVLTPPHGRGLLRGRFTWAIEVVPVFFQHNPERAYGFGFSPLVWRWSLEPPRRYAPFVELGGGGLWTTEDVPGDTTGANYTAHVMAGIRLRNRSGRGALLGYRFTHISNGNRVDPNPGINAHVIVVGWTLVR
jgi:hypothetical protein